MFKYELWVTENIVNFKVLSQPDELRNKQIIFSNSFFTISSYDYPELNEHEIYIQGKDKSRDDMTATIIFNNPKDAQEYYECANTSLQEFQSFLQNNIQQYFPDKLKYQFTRVGCVVIASPIKIPVWSRRLGVIFRGEIDIAVSDFANLTKTTLYLPGIEQIHSAQAVKIFGTEKEAMDWIIKANQSIANCNEFYTQINKETIYNIETTISE